jgi:hypothetical protein
VCGHATSSSAQGQKELSGARTILPGFKAVLGVQKQKTTGHIPEFKIVTNNKYKKKKSKR